MKIKHLYKENKIFHIIEKEENSMDKVIKTFVGKIKSVDTEKFTVEAVVSDESIDSYREVIKADAWNKRLKRYKKNPVLVSSHDYSKLTNQIGKAEKIKIENGELVATFKYFVNEGNPESDWAFKLASKFDMAAFSVGFLPYAWDDGDWDEDVKLGKKPYRTYTDVELCEISQVLVPANSNAVKRSLDNNEENKDMFEEYIQFVNKTISKVTEEQETIEDEIVIEEKTVDEVIIEEIVEFKIIPDDVPVEEKIVEEVKEEKLGTDSWKEDLETLKKEILDKISNIETKLDAIPKLGETEVIFHELSVTEKEDIENELVYDEKDIEESYIELMLGELHSSCNNIVKSISVDNNKEKTK